MNKLIILVILVYSQYSYSYIKSDFDANWGVSFVDITLDGVGTRSLESYSTIKLDYNLIFSSLDMALVFSMSEMFESNFGTIPYTRFGIGPRWYIRGINGNRVLLDNQVQGRLWKPSPFIGLQLGFGSLSLEDGADVQLKSDFNAAVIDTTLEIGLETPVSANMVFIGHFSYLMSALSSSDETRPALSYSGIQLFVGLKMTQF